MENLKQPKPMQLEGNQGMNWKKFKNNFELFSVATGCSEKSKKVQAAVLLHCIGEETLEIIETLGLTEEEKNDPKVIIKKLDEYFIPKANVSVERHKFNTRVQQRNETFDIFLNDLRKIASYCEFGDLKHGLIKDRIVCGILNPKTKDRLLREDKLDLEKAIGICKAAEQTELHIRQLVVMKQLNVN
ncbi:hypothetical protein RI129_006133 [Pyrocoelia pectoralis]|uniref:Uncharacterized protein n=1 Tax=Pyrocoelia pectoralis TaxID=417401 RepID=A0AAN7VDK3_9COLE